MTYEYYGGRIAAGVLGYIHGNLRGAALADKLYRYAYTNFKPKHSGKPTESKRVEPADHGTSTSMKFYRQPVRVRVRGKTRSRVRYQDLKLDTEKKLSREKRNASSTYTESESSWPVYQL